MTQEIVSKPHSVQIKFKAEHSTDIYKSAIFHGQFIAYVFELVIYSL